MKKTGLALVTILMMAFPAFAEEASYGNVELTGLARDSWALNPAGESNAMVCNVNGPDGFLTLRTRPSSNSPSARKLNRLAIVVVDTTQREGNWILVVNSYRTHSKDGTRLANVKELPVTGWAHDDYLCDFLD